MEFREKIKNIIEKTKLFFLYLGIVYGTEKMADWCLSKADKILIEED